MVDEVILKNKAPADAIKDAAAAEQKLINDFWK
jgi:hypothetical protein